MKKRKGKVEIVDSVSCGEHCWVERLSNGKLRYVWRSPGQFHLRPLDVKSKIIARLCARSVLKGFYDRNDVAQLMDGVTNATFLPLPASPIKKTRYQWTYDRVSCGPRARQTYLERMIMQSDGEEELRFCTRHNGRFSIWPPEVSSATYAYLISEGLKKGFFRPGDVTRIREATLNRSAES